jgi:DNA-binding CsgD family transcriptional regulator
VAEAAGSHGFVNRVAEVAVLREAVAGLAAGRGTTVWVEGEPGIGKSALVREGLRGAAAAGCVVYAAAADLLRRDFPLAAALECLRVDGKADDPERAEIARLLRGDNAGSLVSVGDATAAAAELMCELADRQCAVSPVVIVIDDMQWADDASVAVWQRLARSARSAPLLVVGVARPLPRSAAVAYARGLVRDSGGTWLPLGPLPDDDVASLVTGLLGARPGPGLLRLAAQAAGNPLYVRELVDALQREELLRFADGAAEAADGRSGPPSLAAAIEDRLGFLSEGTLESLRHAALLGERFSVRDVAIVAGCSARDLIGVVREAVTAGVLTASGTDLLFRHALIREALADGLPVGLRSGLHQEAARALAAAGAPGSKVAAQLLAATSLLPSGTGDFRAADAWVVSWLAAEASALVHRAPRMAAELLERVMPAAAGEDWEVLADALARALLVLGRFDMARATSSRLIEVTSNELRRVRTVWTLGYALLRQGEIAEAAALVDGALADGALVDGALADKATPGIWRARLEALGALRLLLTQRDTEAAAAAAAALAAAEAAGDAFAGGYALHVMFATRVRAGDDDEALELMNRALALIGDDPEATDLRLMLLSNRLTLLSWLGRDIQAGARELVELAEHAGNTRIGTVRWTIGQHLFQAGRWDDALAELAALFEPEVDADSEDLAEAHGLAALIAVHRDDRAAFDEHLRALEGLPELAGYRQEYLLYATRARAVRAERDGRPGEAAAILAPLAGAAQITVVVRRGDWTPLPDIVRCALAAGDLDTVTAATAAAQAEAERCQPHGPVSALRSAAAACRCRGLAENDPKLLADAVTAYRDMCAPLSLAHALEDLTVTRGAQGDLSGARDALREAVQTYAELGAEWDIMRADARARQRGVRRRRSGTRRPATGWEALTPTEAKVAYLVAEGLSNPEIGSRMFLSWRTVRFHVSAIMNKLGVRSRVEIAREVARAQAGREAGAPRPQDAATAGRA